jgi:uncharacterized protein
MKKGYLKLVRRTFRALRHRRLRHRPWWRTLTRPLFNRRLWIPCRDTVSTGAAIGLFFAMMPIPFQTVPTALIAMRARANIPFAVASCWVTNPFTTPAILFAQYRLGHWMRSVLEIPMPQFLAKAHLEIPGAGSLNAASFVLGFMSSGLLLALCAYPVVHLFSALLPHHLPVRRPGFRARGASGVQLRQNDAQ